MSRKISCKKCRFFRRGISCDFCGYHYYGLSFYDICDEYLPRKGVQVNKDVILIPVGAV